MSHRIEWAMWANENAVISSAILFVGGALAVSSNGLDLLHEYWELGAYAMVLAIFVMLIEYPRGKREKGRTLQRWNQFILTKFVAALSVLGRNYFVRFIFYVLACVPCLLNLGSIMGGVCLLVTACIYLRAAIAGENWIPCEKMVTREKSLTRNRPPSMAPPRLNPTAGKYVNEGQDGDEDGEDYENAAHIQSNGNPPV